MYLGAEKFNWQSQKFNYTVVFQYFADMPFQ